MSPIHAKVAFTCQLIHIYLSLSNNDGRIEFFFLDFMQYVLHVCIVYIYYDKDVLRVCNFD